MTVLLRRLRYRHWPVLSRLPPDDSTVAVHPYQGTLNGLAETIGPLSSGRKQFRYVFGRIKRT
jgi:hypothetical protein